MKISTIQAYKACFCFLKTIWEKDQQTFCNDLPMLLSDMQLLSDDESADPAVINDWVIKIKSESISIEDGYNAIKTFLKMDLYYSDETSLIIEKIATEHDRMWELWIQCIKEVMS